MVVVVGVGVGGVVSISCRLTGRLTDGLRTALNARRLFTSYIMSVANEMADRHRPVDVPLLQDQLFALLPVVWPAPAVVETLLGVYVVVIFYLIYGSSHRWTIAPRFCFIYGALNLTRAFTLSLTSMPDPSPRCAVRLPLEGRPHALLCGLRMLLPVGTVTCGDLMFSGHTVVFVLVTIFWHRYHATIEVGPATLLLRSPRAWVQFGLRFALWPVTLVAVTLIISSRLHYTVDVVIAVLITLLEVYTYYADLAAPTPTWLVRTVEGLP